MAQQLDLNNENLSEDQQNQVLFMMLIQQNQQIAMMGMGKVQNPATGKVERDLKSAKFAIDQLMMLDKYTQGNLPNELKQYLDETLNNLRLNYADEKEKKGDESSEHSSEQSENSGEDTSNQNQQQ